MDTTPGPQFAKLALRDQLITGRGKQSIAEIAARAQRLAEVVMGLPAMRHAATVAAYVSVGREPGTGPLLDAIAASGRRVILPVLRPDNDLDWALYTGETGLAAASRGLLEPTGPRLGLDAVATADLVLVPALAVTRSGDRLGRGGGSYDRALARATGTVVAVVNAEEILPAIPVEPHDRPVGVIATAEGAFTVGR